MEMVWIIRGDVGPSYSEEMDGALMAQARNAYASNRLNPPDDPAVDLQSEARSTVAGSWLIDGERENSRRAWRIELERIDL